MGRLRLRDEAQRHAHPGERRDHRASGEAEPRGRVLRGHPDAIVDLPAVEEDIEELRARARDLENRRHLIWAIGCDYDGCNTVESLKDLIDELVSYTQLPREEVPQII